MKNEHIYVISSDLDIVLGPYASVEEAHKVRDYYNSYLTPKEYDDHKYIAIVCGLDEDGMADLESFDEV